MLVRRPSSYFAAAGRSGQASRTLLFRLHGLAWCASFHGVLHGVAWGCMGLRGVHGQTAHGLDIVCVPTAGAMLVRRSVSVRVAAAGRLARLE